MSYLLDIGVIAIAGLVFAVVLTAILVTMDYAYSALSACLVWVRSTKTPVTTRIVRARLTAD